MARKDRTMVTVVGLGSEGSALAGRLVEAGYFTTVWDVVIAGRGARTTGRVRLGRSLKTALLASPLVITCIATLEDTFGVLLVVAPALAGRALSTWATNTTSWFCGKMTPVNSDRVT
ncbi:NAD(P)-binding domain-containing protein [Amycolatopsis sp. cmx-11-12]|uniref:NAD(P)-binding domain-containing protein n=1 Tax=Amycolatopsis sp. cmx-11-12 TaxID=2785795 RepID=UPI0039180FFA